MNDHLVSVLRAILSGFYPSGWYAWVSQTVLDIPELDMYIIVQEYHVPDDENGRPAELIFKVTFHGEEFFFRKTASFFSYDGIDWSTGDFRQVIPREKVVFEYV